MFELKNYQSGLKMNELSLSINNFRKAEEAKSTFLSAYLTFDFYFLLIVRCIRYVVFLCVFENIKIKICNFICVSLQKKKLIKNSNRNALKAL